MMRAKKKSRAGFAKSCARLALGAGVALLGSLLAFSGESLAGICGDDVGGLRVPCACGDVVTSDTKLLAEDPIVAQRCPLDGLIVDAASYADSLTLDLGGLALRGQGYGMGVRVDDGGDDGALIVGGEIVGFGTGISTHSARTVRRIERVRVKGNRDDGIKIRHSGTLLVDVTATDNGGDGIALRGEGGRLVGVEASRNRGTGLRIISRSTVVEASASENGEHGILVEGVRNELTEVNASDNGVDGILMRGRGNKTGHVFTERNGRAQLWRRGIRRGAGQ